MSCFPARGKVGAGCSRPVREVRCWSQVTGRAGRTAFFHTPCLLSEHLKTVNVAATAESINRGLCQLERDAEQHRDADPRKSDTDGRDRDGLSQ